MQGNDGWPDRCTSSGTYRDCHLLPGDDAAAASAALVNSDGEAVVVPREASRDALRLSHCMVLV